MHTCHVKVGSFKTKAKQVLANCVKSVYQRGHIKLHMLEAKYFTVVISLHLHRNSFQCMFAITLLGCNRSDSFVILHMASKVTYHNGRPGDYLEITAMCLKGLEYILIMVTSSNYAFDSDYCSKKQL